MEAGEARIHKVLDGTKQFLVPHYQRPYSWGEREWEVLWRDIVELAADEGAQPHFMGSIVTAPGRSMPEGVEKRLLIDGQQRLTTLVVLLALIRQRAIAANLTKLANRIASLLMNRDEEGSLDLYKLLPTQGDSAAASDREALLALLDCREPATKSSIVEASRFFATKLARPDAPDLDRLFSNITGRLTLVSIILDKHDNPYRIFESLNGKGLPLTQVDLIRNYFFMRLPEGDHERIYRAKWQPMQQRQVERVSLAPDPDDDQDEPTETKQLQHEFWTLTRAALDATGKFKSLQAARPRFWFDVAIGRSGAWISLNANVAHGRLAVKLTFNEEGAAEMLPRLEAVRADIEREIGSPLEWNPHPEKKFKTIRISRQFSFADRAAWDSGILWLTTTAVAFKQAFAPRVAST